MEDVSASQRTLANNVLCVLKMLLAHSFDGDSNQTLLLTRN